VKSYKMTEEILKAIPVILASAIKFILGPLQGYALKLHPVTTTISTVIGMMISVTAFTFFGDWLKQKLFKNFFNQPTNPSTTRRKFIIVLRKYGLGGIAFFTPILLTPIGGTLLAIGLNKPKSKILIFMLISAVLWSLLLTFAIYSFGRAVLPNFI
jgi:membrane protein DedA with SNARE-associated domain